MDLNHLGDTAWSMMALCGVFLRWRFLTVVKISLTGTYEGKKSSMLLGSCVLEVGCWGKALCCQVLTRWT
jgi:hypothetical protein